MPSQQFILNKIVKTFLSDSRWKFFSLIGILLCSYDIIHCNVAMISVITVLRIRQFIM